MPSKNFSAETAEETVETPSLLQFGKRLKLLRRESKLSQDELCEKINKNNKISEQKINKSLISRYENGIHEPKFVLIQIIADIFDVTTDYLMGIDENRFGSKVIKVDLKKIPLKGCVRAGEPIFVSEEYGEFEFTDNKHVDFALKVTGDSMIGARIYKGDIVFVRTQSDVDNGDIAVVCINNDTATLKRVYKQPGKITLHSENPSMQDMVFSKREMEDVRIVGKVMEVKFKV